MRENWIGAEVLSFYRGGLESHIVTACDFCARSCYPRPSCRGDKPRLVQMIEMWLEHEAEGREIVRRNEIMLEVAKEYGI